MSKSPASPSGKKKNSPRPPPPPVENSVLEVGEKDIADMGMYSPSSSNKGWNKITPKFKRLSVRAGDAGKGVVAPMIAPVNLDDDSNHNKNDKAATTKKEADDVERIRKKNQERLAEVARKKEEREAAAALRKSKRESIQQMSASQLNYDHSDDDDDDDEGNDKVASLVAKSKSPPVSPRNAKPKQRASHIVTSNTTRPTSVSSTNRRSSTGSVNVGKSPADANLSLYSPQKVKKFVDSDKGFYSPASSKQGWKKVAPKLAPPEL